VIDIRKSQQPKFGDGETLNITLDNASIYTKTSETSKLLTTLNYSDKVTLVEVNEDYWYKIKTKEGKIGYVRSWEVTNNNLVKKEDRPEEPKSEYTIILDPGHGGGDPGAESNDGHIYEKDLTLATAKQVKKELESHGYNVLMTRSKDEFVSLSNISKISNQSKSDAFISFHYDSSGKANEGSGTTTFYRHPSGKPLAQAVNDKIASILPLENRGFASEDYQVLRENKKPAILIELGYMNNDTDVSYAKSKKYHEKVGQAVEKGVSVYLNKLKKEASQ